MTAISAFLYLHRPISPLLLLLHAAVDFTFLLHANVGFFLPLHAISIVDDDRHDSSSYHQASTVASSFTLSVLRDPLSLLLLHSDLSLLLLPFLIGHATPHSLLLHRDLTLLLLLYSPLSQSLLLPLPLSLNGFSFFFFLLDSPSFRLSSFLRRRLSSLVLSSVHHCLCPSLSRFSDHFQYHLDHLLSLSLSSTSLTLSLFLFQKMGARV